MAPINPAEFIELVQPLLETKDMSGLLTMLRSRWTPDQIKSILGSNNSDARNIAILALGLVGPKCSIKLLVEQLKSSDLMTNEMAEHALWSIWFRCGNDDANCKLARGAAALDQKDFVEAARLFSDAIESDPSFAEPYNQRAIVHYLQEHYDSSIADCLETIERMPCHFGAWAGMGHCHAHLGQLPEAIRCYRQALELNPHLQCLSEAVHEMQQHLNNAGH